MLKKQIMISATILVIEIAVICHGKIIFKDLFSIK